MRIVCLSQFYAPEPGFKVHQLAKSLVEKGHEVTVLTGFPNYPQGKLFPGYRQKLWQIGTIDGVTVIRVPLVPDHSKSAFWRGLNYLSFMISASCLGPWLCGRADVMYVYHPPLTIGIPAWWIGLLRGIPFVYEIQDMWPESVAASGMLSKPGAVRMLAAMARFVYAQAAAISVISQGFKTNLVMKGVASSKIEVIPNWADGEVYHPVLREPDLGKESGMAGKFNVVFAGNLGTAQALDSVIEAARLLESDPIVQFVFIGDGVEKTRLAKEAPANVKFIERQAEDDMKRYFAWADALLIHLKCDPLFEITIPGKTIAYLACGKPIICAVAGDAAATILEASAGLVTPPEDAAALSDAIRKLLSMSEDERAEMGASGRSYFLSHFDQPILVGRMEALLQRVAAGT